jgi:serine/threonine protein kinase
MRDEHNDRTMVERIDPLMGSVLDRQYRIDFRLASGGFGSIYRATHVESGQQYALKVLHGELATSDARVIARFRREHSTLVQLKNQHTVQAYDFGEAPDGSLYFAMELLDGESLYEIFRSKGPLPWQRVAAIGRMVCSSLGEAHALGIVHRDLKPANIHLEHRHGNPDFVKVLDFGIAKINRGPGVMPESELDATELTQAGQMIGTFDYMAPEQMVGGQCTGVTDIYTLGVVLYEMVCGRRPFSDATSPTAMLAALLTQAPPSLDTPGVPLEFENILMRCLEREPQNRYETVEELAADFDRLILPGATRKMNATPPPVIIHDETTVIDHRRAKRGSAPHVVRRDEPAPTALGRPKRQSEPPAVVHDRPKRDSTPPNVIRRNEGTGPIPVAPKRDSRPVNVVRRDRDSQPVALLQEQQQDPHAWQSLQLPKRDGRDSQPIPAVRQERDHIAMRDDAVPVARPQPDSKPIQRAYQAGAFAVAPDPGYPPQAYVTPAPILPAPILRTPVPIAPTPSPHTPMPQLVDRPSSPVVDPNWRPSYPQLPPTPPTRGGYDMAGAQSRDVVVRRVVWSIALILGVILALVVASRL